MQRPIYIAKLVKYLLHHEAGQPENHDRQTLAAYLARIGQPQAIHKSPQQIATLLLDENRPDWFIEGTKRFIFLDQVKNYFMPSTAACDAVDLELVADWLLHDNMRQLYPDRTNYTLRMAEQVLYERFHVTRAMFLDSVRRWHQYDPWTCVVGTEKNSPIGMSLVIPLTLDAYVDARSGNRLPCQFEVEDLERPSRFIMIQAISPRPNCKRFSSEVIANRLLINIMHQIALLTYCDGDMGKEPLHVLTFGSSDVTEKRLVSDNYTRLKTTLPGTKMPLYERVLCQQSFLKNPNEWKINALLQGLGKTSEYQLAPQKLATGHRF